MLSDSGILLNKHPCTVTMQLGYAIGMCISITEADAIRISMHSQRYDTLKIHMKQLAIRCDTIHPYYDAVRFDFDSMQYDPLEKI